MSLAMKILLNCTVHLKNDYFCVENQSDVKENLIQFHFIHYKPYRGLGMEPQASAVRNQHLMT